jgi:hypothetical protein
MTEENMNKIYWVIALLVIVLGLKTYVIDPSYNQIKAQQTGIDNISYVAP